MTNDELMATYNILTPDLKHDITDKAQRFLNRYIALIEETGADAKPLKIRDGITIVMRAIYENW